MQKDLARQEDGGGCPETALVQQSSFSQTVAKQTAEIQFLLTWKLLCEGGAISWSSITPCQKPTSCLGAPNRLGKERSGGISWLLCARSVCLPLTFYPSTERWQEQLVPDGSVLSICKHRDGSGWFYCINWREMMSQRGVVWYTVQLLKTFWGFKSPFLWLLNPPTISDFAWGSIHRQNSAGHIGFVVMTIVQRRVPTCRKSFLHCFKADKATMGVLGIPSSRLSSLARWSKILRYLQRAEQDHKWEQRPLVFFQGKSLLQRKTLFFCSAAVYLLSNHWKLITTWLEDGLMWKQAHVTDWRRALCWHTCLLCCTSACGSVLHFRTWIGICTMQIKDELHDISEIKCLHREMHQLIHNPWIKCDYPQSFFLEEGTANVHQFSI